MVLHRFPEPQLPQSDTKRGMWYLHMQWLISQERDPHFRARNLFIMRSQHVCPLLHHLDLPRLLVTQAFLRRRSRAKADRAQMCRDVRDLWRTASQQEASHILLKKNLRNHVNHVQYFLTRKHLSWFFNVSQNCKTFSFSKGKNTMKLPQYYKCFCFFSCF